MLGKNYFKIVFLRLWSIFGKGGVKETVLRYLIIDYNTEMHILQDETSMKKRKRKITDITDYQNETNMKK